VGAAVTPSPETMKTFQKYTPAPVDGMPAPIYWFSSLAISRWGLESLSDLCVHGEHSTGDAAYKIVNTVSISLHPNDVPSLLKGLSSIMGASFEFR